jgi:hypothetical protein
VTYFHSHFFQESGENAFVSWIEKVAPSLHGSQLVSSSICLFYCSQTFPGPAFPFVPKLFMEGAEGGEGGEKRTGEVLHLNLASQKASFPALSILLIFF